MTADICATSRDSETGVLFACSNGAKYYIGIPLKSIVDYGYLELALAAVHHQHLNDGDEYRPALRLRSAKGSSWPAG